MEMKRVFSSHIDSVGYDPDTRELHVQYQGKKDKPGKTAVFMDVPQDVAKLVVDAPSVGTAVHQFLKDKYAHGYQPG